MRDKSLWLLVILPNLILGLNRITGRQRVHYDQGYLAPDQQLWIEFLDPGHNWFRGVWVSKDQKKNVSGHRSGNTYVFLSGAEKWTALLSPARSCSSRLEVQHEKSREKTLFQANFCGLN